VAAHALRWTRRSLRNVPAITPMAGTLLIWSLLALQAMRGAKGHAAELAAKNPSFGSSSRCAESRKRIVVSTIAIETSKRAHSGGRL